MLARDVNSTETIGSLVKNFLDETVRHGRSTFRMEELRRFVSKHVPLTVSPESPGRVLRMLRKQKLISYTLVSRVDSLYRIEAQ